MIRVLECIRQGQIGGGESHLLSLVENLDRSRFSPEVLSFTDGPMVDRLRAMDVPVHIIPTTKPFDFRKWGAVKQLIGAGNFDLVHAHGTRASSNVLWAAKSLKLPVIYTVHGWSFHQDQKPLVRNIRIMGERYITSRTNLNISVSASNQQSGKQFMKSFDSIVVNNGIDLRRFNPDSNTSGVRKELGLSDDAVLVLFLARFTGHKQPLSLIRAFALAAAKNTNLHLLMVGDGDEKAEAVRLIRDLGLEKRITLQPFRQDVPQVLAAADLFVLPSLWEGLPIGLLEAMAMGKAVIATNVDGTCEVVQHDRNGWLVETDNLIPNLALAIEELSNDENRRRRYSRGARERVNDQFNAEGMTRKIEELYEQYTITGKPLAARRNNKEQIITTN